MKKLILMLIISMFSITSVQAQCEITQLGFRSVINEPSSIFIKGRNAYVTSRSDNLLDTYLISNPSSIIRHSLIQNGMGATQLTTPFSVFVKGKRAYVVSNAANSLSIFDVRDPENIVELDAIVDGVGATGLASATSVFVKGKVAYVASFAGRSLSTFDVSDPTNIVELDVIKDDSIGGTATGIEAANSVFVSGNVAYVTAYGEDALSTFDVSDPTNITELDVIKDDDSGGTATELDGANTVFVKGKLAYVTAGIDDSLSVFDVSNPAVITQLATIKDTTGVSTLGGARSVFVKGKRAYVAAFEDDAFSVLDVSTVTPEQCGH